MSRILLASEPKSHDELGTVRGIMGERLNAELANPRCAPVGCMLDLQCDADASKARMASTHLAAVLDRMMGFALCQSRESRLLGVDTGTAFFPTRAKLAHEQLVGRVLLLTLLYTCSEACM